MRHRRVKHLRVAKRVSSEFGAGVTLYNVMWRPPTVRVTADAAPSAWPARRPRPLVGGQWSRTSARGLLGADIGAIFATAFARLSGGSAASASCRGFCEAARGIPRSARRRRRRARSPSRVRRRRSCRCRQHNAISAPACPCGRGDAPHHRRRQPDGDRLDHAVASGSAAPAPREPDRLHSRIDQDRRRRVYGATRFGWHWRKAYLRKSRSPPGLRKN